MFFKRIFLPLFILLIALLFLISICYALMVRTWNANWPEWATTVIPIIISIAVLAIFKDKLLKILLRGQVESKRLNNQLTIVLYICVPILTTIMFSPLTQSIKYNFGKVLTLESINDLKPNESPAFLQLNDWYVDRMRVIPLKTLSRPNLFNFNSYQVNLLFIVPIFSNKDAYRSHAKAWLAFEYVKGFSKKELEERLDDEFVKESMTHFKRMNIREFRYLEIYPRNDNYNAFIQMAQVHNYFKSGFGTVYKGQEVDRDILSAYFFKYFLFLFAIVAIPGLFIISGISQFLIKRSKDNIEIG